jgi:cytochrome b
LALLASITGEFGAIHSWLGYGVGVVIIFRLLWALGGNKQVGISRFYLDFEGLNVTNALTHPAISKSFLLAVALSVIAATMTGIAFENIDGHNDFVKETHEFFANAMLLFVCAHVAYLILFKRPLAKFMLFIQSGK